MPCSCSQKKHSLLLVAAAAVGAAAAAGLMLGCASKKRQSAPALPTVDHVVLERYVGTWYEIARLPNRFQTQCVRNVRAEYTLADGGMRVRNSCVQPSGKTRTATGFAKVEPGSGNARLSVSFFRPFYGPYWVLALDREYAWSLVGSPDRKQLWILSRNPHLPQDVQQRIIARAAELGFATEALLFTQQDEAAPVALQP